MRPTSTTFLAASAFVAVLLASPAAVRAEDGPAPAAAPEKVQLRVSAKSGDKHRYLQTQSQTGSMMGMEMGQTITNELTWTCTSSGTDGATQWDVLFGAVRGSISNPMLGGEIEFDTTQPAADADAESPAAMLVKALGAMTNKTAKLTLSPRGSVQKVDGLKELIEGMMAGASEEDMGAQMLSAMFTDETIAQSWAMAIPALPEGGISVGDTWTAGVTFSAGPGQSLELKTKNTLTKATADDVHVTMKLDFDFKEFVRDMAVKAAAEEGRELSAEEQAKMEEMFGQMTMDFTGAGTARFGRKDGLLAESSMDMLMKIEMGADEGGMMIEQSIKSNLKHVDAFPVAAKKAAPLEPAAPVAPVAPAAPVEPEKK